jgi:phosphoglycerate dehydrogenase-like enzyme
LKLLVTAGMRNLGIDLAACRDRGILVCGTDSGSTPTAELAWGLILALARRIPEEDRALREGKWQIPVTGFGLQDKVLGILGLGRLGREMARIGQAFGMKIIAWSQNLTSERAAQAGAVRVEKGELFRMSDVLTVHLLMSERTRGLVGRSDIALMKPSAIFINTARAAIVDEAALVEALMDRKIAGAGLDVYSREPLPQDAPILRAPNTVLTPHLGYAVRESYEIYYSQALEDIEAWLAGAPIRVIAG